MKKKEYIDRECAENITKNALYEWTLAMAAADGKREINHVYKRQELLKAVLAVFEHAPAADVAPVTHGRWESSGGVVWCSACGAVIAKTSYDPAYGYCPHCGAKMDGEQEDKNK